MTNEQTQKSLTASWSLCDFVRRPAKNVTQRGKMLWFHTDAR